LLKNGLEFRNFSRNGPEKKILVDNDLKLNSASLKSRIIKLKNKLIFVDNSQEEDVFSKPISYYYFDLEEPHCRVQFCPVKPMFRPPEATIFIQKATQKDLS